MATDLIRRVHEKQLELMESDEQFAKRLGVHRETWRLARTGRLVGRRTLRGIVSAFPEFRDAVKAFILARDVHIYTSDEADMHEEVPA